VFALWSCAGDPSVFDAAVDAPRPYDAYYVCQVPQNLCPAEQPYCCSPGCLECVSTCRATPVDSCEESPAASDEQSCDREVVPTGCPVERPVCCFYLGVGTTFCVDHALVGPHWLCSEEG
jgi:hypothetical protein